MPQKITSLELYRRQLLGDTMPPLGVVKHLDVIEHIASRLIPIAIDPSLDPLTLEQLEEAFGDCIVMTVATATHAANKIVASEKTLPIRAAELTALVGVDHYFLLRFTSPDGHQQRINGQVAAHARFHRPANDLAREQIEHYRQIQPAFIGADVGDVGDPDLVRLADVELALQPVRRWCGWLATIATSTSTVAGLRTQSFRTHQPGDTMPPTALTQFAQICMDLSIAINPTTLQPGMLDQTQQTLIVLGSCRPGLGAPGVVATWMYFQHLAETLDRVARRQLVDERVPQPDSLAKYAAAFFRMSRSSVTRLSSARRRRSSACWSSSCLRWASGLL